MLLIQGEHWAETLTSTGKSENRSRWFVSKLQRLAPVPKHHGKDDDDDEAGRNLEGLPVCIAATKIDVLVLALTPSSHNYNDLGAVVGARARRVAGPGHERRAAQPH